MFTEIGNWLISLIYEVWYGGLFAASFIENLIPPVPSEVIMPLGGYLAWLGKLDVILVIIVCTLGSTLGNLPYYLLGWFLNERKITQFVAKYGKYFFAKPEYVKDLYEVFKKNDKKIVFFGRFLPGARGFIGLPAGSAKMNFLQFFFYTLMGTLVWTVFLVFLGYRMGAQRETVVKYTSEYEHIMIYIVALGLAGFIAYIIYNRNKKKQHGK